MKLVRFKFYGNSHQKPHTGHLLITAAQEGGWRISSSNFRRKEVSDIFGQDPFEGGKQFLDEMNGFIVSWAVAQGDAIEKHRLWSSGKSRSQVLTRRGFRPMSAEKQWKRYVRDTAEEIGCIRKDVIDTYDALLAGGWLREALHPEFPTFVFGDPAWAD